MKTAVMDASSSILLYKSGMVTHFLRHYKTRMVRSALEEIMKKGYPGFEAFSRFVNQNRIHPLEISEGSSPLSGKLAKLDQGERDTIHAYLQGNGHFVVIDDGQGAGFCRKHHIPYINALLVPRILFESGKMSHDLFEAAFSRITKIGRYTPQIIDYARNCPQADLDCFEP
ncbi:MAG: hypothetical protein D3926_22430 [Desulfobacteraceae bacterium]|nr:MAG: hypothetical protein D3926_22430 [Desulfobacteraceae bacterium]